MSVGLNQVGGGVQHQNQVTQKLSDFVQATKSFFGKAVTWIRNVPDRIASHFAAARQAQQPPVEHHEPTPLTQASVEKALSTSKVAFDAIHTLGILMGGVHPTVGTCQTALGHVNTAARLLTGDIPMGGPEWTAMHGELGQCETDLRQQLNDIDQQIQEHFYLYELTDVRNSVDQALQQVTARKEYLENFQGSHALSQTKVAEAKLGWAEAAARVIDAEIAKLPGNVEGQLKDPRTIPLENLKLEILQGASQELMNANPRVNSNGGNLKTMAKDLGTTLATKFKELGIPGDQKVLAKAVNQEHVNVLNDRDWNPINNEIQFVHDGKPHTFQSDITPAAHLDTLKLSYDGKGICCQSRSEANHMVNLTKTSLTNENGEVLFEGVRHGIVSAFGLEGQERTDANFRRADELLLGVISSKDSLLQAALNQQDGDDPLELDMTSINLLTPDFLRWQFGGKDGGTTDRAITRDQLNTLQAIDNTVRSLTFTDPNTNQTHTIRVKPNIAAFSFGVNEGATRDGKLGTMMYYGGGKGSFDTVREDNRVAMNKLIGDPSTDAIAADSKIGRFLADPNVSDIDKQIVTELREQIRDMWNNDGYMAHGGDPHKMVARISVLTHLLGDTACFNCKSGKDRTGTLDVEAKFLATRIHFAKQEALASGVDLSTISLVPSPGPLNTEDKAIFRQFAIRSGNLEVQEYNTGIGGYKTAAQEALQRRLGTDEAISRFKGGSGHVKA